MDIDKDTGFQRLWHIYNEALKSGCFIYDKDKKEWMTPEGFREKYDNKAMKHSYITGLLDDLVIRDPVAGINAGRKQVIEKFDNFKIEIEKDLLKISEFSILVIQYYQNKSKK